MADELAAHGADAHQRDQVTERHRSAERLDGDDVAEDCQHVAVALEGAARTRIGDGEGLRRSDLGVHQGGRTHRHRAVGEDHDHVQAQADAEDPHAGDVAVHERESGQGGERRPEHGALGTAIERTRRQLEADTDDDDGGIDDDRRP